MTPPFAHVGHWSIYLLYAAPIVIVVVSIVRELWRQRRGGGPPG